MTNPCILTGILLGGWAGWWIGAKFNFGWAFLFGCIGCLAGAFTGWGISHNYF